jgi:hypothetical protein
MEDDSVAVCILAYLRRCPQAADTIEGITHWWVMGQRLVESVEEVRRSIESLKAKGLINEHTGPDGRSIFTAAPTDVAAKLPSLTS